MQPTSLVVWLGNPEKIEARLPYLVGVVEDGASQSPPGGPISRHAHPDDCDLIRDTIMIFDATLDQFDKDDDYQTRQMIDRLAMDVLNRIRECTKKLASVRPRVVS